MIKMKPQPSFASNFDWTFFGAAPISFVDIDEEGRLVSINAAGLKFIGAHDKAEILGRPYIDFVCSADRSKIQRLFTNALEGQSVAFDFATTNTELPQCLSSCFIPCPDEQGVITSKVSIT